MLQPGQVWNTLFHPGMDTGAAHLPTRGSDRLAPAAMCGQGRPLANST